MKTRAFTLVELLVTVATLVLLIALLLPALGKAREAARRAQCGSHLRQMSIAVIQYSVEYRGLMPYGYWPAQTPNTIFGRIGLMLFNHTGALMGHPSAVQPGSRLARMYCPSYFNSRGVENDYLFFTYGYLGTAGDQGQFPHMPNNPTPQDWAQRLRRIQHVIRPQSAVMFHDSGGAWGSSRPTWHSGNAEWAIRAPRTHHLRKANILFFDGHVEDKNQEWSDAISLSTSLWRRAKGME